MTQATAAEMPDASAQETDQGAGFNPAEYLKKGRDQANKGVYDCNIATIHLWESFNFLRATGIGESTSAELAKAALHGEVETVKLLYASQMATRRDNGKGT